MKRGSQARRKSLARICTNKKKSAEKGISRSAERSRHFEKGGRKLNPLVCANNNLNSFRKRIRKIGCQLIATLVVGVSVVSLDPNKVHLVVLQKSQQLFPKVGIEGRGLVGFFPALGSPTVDPALCDRVYEIFGVGGQGDLTGLLQGSQGFNGGSQGLQWFGES